MTAMRTAWRTALNPPIYLVSVLPGLGVPLLADGPVLHGFGLLLATLAVVLLQHAINLFNDAADWRLGADLEKFDSWVRVHGERTDIAVLHGVISLLIGGCLGLGVLWYQGQLWILLIGLPMVALGYLYNAGSKPLSYTHFGEWVTGICYGPGVFGCLWLVAGLTPGVAMLAGMLGFGAIAVALLLSHQPPQIDTDRRAGKLSFAVRFGARRTFTAARLLFLMFVATLGGVILATRPPLPAALLAGLAVFLVYRLSRDDLNPRRVLLAASGFVAVGLAASAPLWQ
jgi:1,4-dihydroxy-2-naphthoate octaprenyltransferase